VFCSERLTLLLSINDAVNTACSSADKTKAILGFTDHLKTLQGIENITESNCTTGIFITIV